MGFPVKENTKYLGVIVDDCGSFKSEIKALMTTLNKMKSTLYKANAQLLHEKYYIWKTLLESQVMHKLVIIQHFSKPA